MPVSAPAPTALAVLHQLEGQADRLAPAQRQAFRSDLTRLREVLSRGQAAAPRPRSEDPYQRLITARGQGTPLDLQASIAAGGQPPGGQPPAAAAPPATPAPPPRADATQTIGARAADALEAVGFTDFVAGLVRGTFQAIVDATAQQMREYADLVASISRTAEEFTRDNVTDDQVRQWLTARHPADLYVAVPPPGREGGPRLRVRPAAVGQEPEWLKRYGAEGNELTDELVEEVLLGAARRQLGEERLSQLASMVLMGVNRVVIKDGHIAAKLQFHAAARDKTAAETMLENRANQGSIAQRQSEMNAGAVTMVSTIKANAQADSSIRADLMGEVRIRFATESFNLNSFADTAAIQLISRHARWQGEVPAAGATPTPSAGTAPAPALPPTPEEGNG